MPEIANRDRIRNELPRLEKWATRLFYLFLLPLLIPIGLYLLLLVINIVAVIPSLLASVFSGRFAATVNWWNLTLVLAYFPLAGIAIWLEYVITNGMSTVIMPARRLSLALAYGILYGMTWYRTFFPISEFILSRQSLFLVAGLIGIAAAGAGIAVALAFSHVLRQHPFTGAPAEHT
jgi:hypothetical protein